MGTGHYTAHQGSVPPCVAECEHGDLSDGGVVAAPGLPGLGPGPVPAGPQLRPVLPRLIRPLQPPASPLASGTGTFTSCQVEDTLCIFVRAVNGTSQFLAFSFLKVIKNLLVGLLQSL